jgi:two-component system OmpR family response regulator
MRLLVAEDNRALALSIARAFAANGHAVDCVHDGEEADAALATGSGHDLVILDLGLPVLDGLEVLRRLRRRSSRIPVLILTARDAVADRVQGLDLGADDYLGKPFALEELVARAGALMRRGAGGEPAVVRVGQVELDTAARLVRVAGEVVELRRRELNLLEVLIARRGQVVPKQVLVDKLFGMDDEGSDTAVETYVYRLRKKLAHAGVRIRTLRGLGYLLEEP